MGALWRRPFALWQLPSNRHRHCLTYDSSIVNPHDLGGTKVQTSPQPNQPAPRDRWIDLRELEQLCCFKKSTIYAMLRDRHSKFPRPVRLSTRMVRWSENEVQQWMQDRVAAGSISEQHDTAVQA
jgi:prophage regulatory protein